MIAQELEVSLHMAFVEARQQRAAAGPHAARPESEAAMHTGRGAMSCVTVRASGMCIE